MINRYTDHAANERTYLAWICTAIAIMVFGFLTEKFGLFISYVGKAIGDEEHFSASIPVGFFWFGIILGWYVNDN